MAEHLTNLTGSEHGVYLSFAVQDEYWALRANCDDPDADEFFVKVKGSADPLNLKEKYCRDCPVTEDCLADDILHGVSDATIRGGINHGERLKMRRAISMNRPYVPQGEKHLYRNSGFADQMTDWRMGVVDEIQQTEIITTAIEKQIDAGTVSPDAYYETMQSRLASLRGQLITIDNETKRQ